VVVVAALGLCAWAGCVSRSCPIEPGHHALHMDSSYEREFELDYLLFLPSDYAEAGEPWPLIMFLHGAGERGVDLNDVKRIGICRRVSEDPSFPFIVLSPQCPPNRWWVPHMLVVLLDDVIADYNIDRDRVYLTGLSMGGTGTWSLAAEYPDRFAAIAPVCGRSRPLQSYPLNDMPVWAFHGEQDHVVDVWNSVNQVNRLRGDGNELVKLTLYPDLKHGIWDETYGNPELYRWFLMHRRSDRR
jgi:predicted peptidase